MDYNIDSAGKHSLMLRGTLNGAGQDSTLAQFPGQAAASRTLDNSRGLAARYTAVISPHLVNVLTYGYTRLGNASTGNQTVIPTFGFTTLTPTARPSQRVAPTTNVTDDLPGPRAATPCNSASISASSKTTASPSTTSRLQLQPQYPAGPRRRYRRRRTGLSPAHLRQQHRSLLGHQRDQRLRDAVRIAQ